MERVLCSCIVRLTGANINKQTTSLKFVLISAYQSPSILPSNFDGQHKSDYKKVLLSVHISGAQSQVPKLDLH